MDIKIKVRRKNHLIPAGTGGSQYSYNLTIKIKNAGRNQVDNIHKAVLQATGE